MAALDFPNSPTANQQYAAPNGVTYQWDGAAWIVTGGPPGQLWTASGATLTPTDATKAVAVPGPTTTDQSQVIYGTLTVKGRLTSLTVADWIGFTANDRYDGSAFHQDDATKPSYRVYARPDTGDGFYIDRAPAGSGSGAGLLSLVPPGNLTIYGATATKASGTTWANPSDRRLKESINDYTTGLAAIQGLLPRTFVFNGKAGTQAGLPNAGFISDEVAPVMPDMILPYTARLEPDDPEETELYAVDQSNLILALVNAVKELLARIVELEKPGRPPQGPAVETHA